MRRKERIKRESKTLNFFFFFRMFRIFIEMESARRTVWKEKQYILLSKDIELESYKIGMKSQLFHLLVVWFAHVALVPRGYLLISKIMKYHLPNVSP